MRALTPTTKFRRDYKRERKSDAGLDAVLQPVLDKLSADLPLAKSNCDHALNGDWADHRDCHIRPDLVLIYAKPADGNLILARLGSHAELFG
ncbi:type II toxin-antitoxin system mRNA interferase toxin, RelE/StbE family [Altererythrobacter confluentis]|uniref:Type II toxin-antitoxin system mRNA interferase toxin, RelE/StbE family n=1 Tax=Allopontixanthobacter confluentis TaxID=1849021 RepID=A0A6L7GK51_9SPHN|nr:type II toxin-antitoxin system YafQ family toxin [Allopontixanthobacter confluentis]MXP15684.1 type II toxin-antitoxin system mRNA interferase toxin, RelE/StbE family [Allopontixanthobacter confluentis]